MQRIEMAIVATIFIGCSSSPPIRPFFEERGEEPPQNPDLPLRLKMRPKHHFLHFREKSKRRLKMRPKHHLLHVREKSKPSARGVREKFAVLVVVAIASLVISCSSSAPVSPKEAPDYRSTGEQSEFREKSIGSDGAVREKSAGDEKPSCEGLEGEFREKCVRGLAVLRSICPDGDVGADGCVRCPDLQGLQDKPTPYGFRNIEQVRDQMGERMESYFLLFEGCSQSNTVVLVEAGDHVRPWIVRDIVDAPTTDLSLYRVKTVCPDRGECNTLIVKPGED